MEEDIKILEEFAQDLMQDYIYRKDVTDAIQNLIARYEELDNKNKSLKKEIGLMKSININDNFIPKSKVQEKIEEYKRKMEKDVNYLSKDYFNYRHKIYALQELLEES